MKLGYTIIYVPNVAESLSFFESAFGLSRRFLHESGDYGELETGETTLAFASHELGNANFPTGFVAASESSVSSLFGLQRLCSKRHQLSFLQRCAASVAQRFFVGRARLQGWAPLLAFGSNSALKRTRILRAAYLGR
jgi:catechol 2,3-dioxygenase-like lactoylglutathione lyase family enzyme